MAKELVKEVHFTIEGAFLADFARTRLQEGAYQHALKVLDCLEGLPLEEQIAILKGEKTLTGENNNITLVEADLETQKEMKKWYQEKYSRIFSFDGRYYEPYAFVQSWCSEDLPKHSNMFSAASKNFIQQYEPQVFDKMYNKGYENYLKDHPHSRSLFYAHEPQRDLALTVSQSQLNHKMWEGDAVVLFKEVNEQMPFWVADHYAKDPVEAVNQALAVRGYISRTGAEVEFYDVEPYSDYMTEEQDITQTEAYKSRRDAFIKDYTERKQDEYWDNYEKQVTQYTQEVIDFANNDKEYGWKELIDEENPEHRFKVPYRAFLHFSVGRARFSDRSKEVQLPEYTPIFPTGMKMMNDDPYHTDCWVGAGFSLDNAYNHDDWQNELFFKKAFECQDMYFKDADFNILNTAKKTKLIGHTVNIKNYQDFPKGQRILVLPHLGVEFETVALQCDAIITETGGKLAHLVTVGREMGIPVIRIENACIQFAFPDQYKFDLQTLKIENISEKEEKKNKLKP